MRYTRLEMAGDTSIEHTVEGAYEEVLVFFLELEKNVEISGTPVVNNTNI